MTLLFGVHDGEEIGGGFVSGFLLPCAPMDEEAVTEAAKEAHDAHRSGGANTAVIFEMGDVQALVQSAFNAPSRPVAVQPLRGRQFARREAGDQCHGFRAMVAQVAPEQRDLFDAGKIDLLRRGGAGAEDAGFELAFVKFTAAGQSRVLVLREKARGAALEPGARSARAWWAGYL